jgi:hypothetical protein
VLDAHRGDADVADVPAKALVLEEGGGTCSATPALSSPKTSPLAGGLALEARDGGFVVIGHTGCGLLTLENDELRATIGGGATGVDFLPFRDLDQSVRASVRRVRESPLLPESFGATGMVYDVETGRVRARARAGRAGKRVPRRGAGRRGW